MSNTKGSKEVVTLKEAAKKLTISTATLRNWIKHNYIVPIRENGSICFRSNEIESLMRNIRSGKITRLSNRANKLVTKRTFIPEEYVEDKRQVKLLRTLIEFISVKELDSNTALFLLSINLMVDKKLIKCNDISKLFNFQDLVFKFDILKDELQDWYHDLDGIIESGVYLKLLSYKLPKQDDVLGLIYQSMLQEGSKSKGGTYFTPVNIVEDIISEYAKPDSEVLDPCCGSGQFLLAASLVVRNVCGLNGFDIDPIAIRIAKINMISKLKINENKVNIFLKNTIMESEYNDLFLKSEETNRKYDLIVTNPPWGSFFDSDDKKKLDLLYPSIKSHESFSYFLHRGIDLLKKDGILSFILPESILHVNIHKDIRKYILKNTSIRRIIFLDRVFKHVFTSVIRLDLKKCVSVENKIEITKGLEKYEINQKRLLTNQDYVFDIHTKNEDLRILKKVYNKDHKTLRNNAEWALGIVTGDNKKFIHSELKEGFEEIIKGKDVQRYRLSKAMNYLKFNPEEFQQVAPELKFRAKEKLIYRFISKKLVFAYDNQKKLTLNSANVLIPEIDGYPIKVILALLNSELYQFIFRKKFSSIKVLRSHIEQLPFPSWNNTVFKEIVKFVDLILKRGQLDVELNNYIYEKFGLTARDQKYIRKFVKEL